MLTAGLVVAGAIGLGAGVAALWPSRRADSPPEPSPARHRAADAHTGSFSARTILDRLDRGEDPIP